MDSVGRKFMDGTKYQNMGKSAQMEDKPHPPLEEAYDDSKPIIDLPKPPDIKLGTMSLREVIDRRRSRRAYSDQPLSLEELSYLLWCTQGVQKTRADQAFLRTVPSAGARHAFETYLLVNNVEGLKPGLYRFLASRHCLQEIDLTEGLADRCAEACLGQRIIKSCAVTFIWVAVAYRMTWRYNERGYRYLHLDAGHVCQNLYLGAESIDCGTCAVGAFSDDDLNRVLNFDGADHFVIYLAPVGHKP